MLSFQSTAPLSLCLHSNRNLSLLCLTFVGSQMQATACIVDITWQVGQCAKYTIIKRFNFTFFLASMFKTTIPFAPTCNPIIHCLKAYWLLITVVETVARMINTV